MNANASFIVLTTFMVNGLLNLTNTEVQLAEASQQYARDLITLVVDEEPYDRHVVTDAIVHHQTATPNTFFIDSSVVFRHMEFNCREAIDPQQLQQVIPGGVETIYKHAYKSNAHKIVSTIERMLVIDWMEVERQRIQERQQIQANQQYMNALSNQQYQQHHQLQQYYGQLAQATNVNSYGGLGSVLGSYW